MTNITLLNTNFKSIINDVKSELNPYIEVLYEYEQYLDFSEYSNRVSIVYPVGNTQKSLYANRILDKKKPVYRDFKNYNSLQLFFPKHKTLNHTIQLKEGKFETAIIEEIKYSIFKETGYNLTDCEAAIAIKYKDYVLLPHIDGDQSESSVTNRFHLILETTETNYFEDENGDRCFLKEGEIWNLDVAKMHGAGNHSSQRVMHLVLDFKK
jgi:hypothetical protein